MTPSLKLLFYLYFKIEHGGYYAPELAVTASNLVYVVVQSSTRLEDHIKIQDKQRRGFSFSLEGGTEK